jgi:hypothetical protein
VLGSVLDDQAFESQQGVGIYLFTTMSKLVLALIQPHIQWVPGALSLEVKLTTHLHLVLKSRLH